MMILSSSGIALSSAGVPLQLPHSWPQTQIQSSSWSLPISSSCRCYYSQSQFNQCRRRPAASKLSALLQSSSSSVNQVEEEQIRVLTSLTSNYNDILILDTSKSRVLLLDPTHNVHSIFNKETNWTSSYWDEFASLPPIVPDGPIAIFGLGGGTAARLMLELWPSLQLEGWEIDEILIDKARDYLGLSDLEKDTKSGGVLHVHIGDALSPSSTIPGGYAGIVIDLFSNGKVLSPLQEVSTWLELGDKLIPNGRLMVNCGGICGPSGDISDATHPETLPIDGTWEQNSTLRTLYKAFPGELSWKKMPRDQGENFLGLSGPLPDLPSWSAALPNQLSSSVNQWRNCMPS